MNENIQKPSLRHLKDYLHYQHPSTKGDIQLNLLCDVLANFLATELKTTKPPEVWFCIHCGNGQPSNHHVYEAHNTESGGIIKALVRSLYPRRHRQNLLRDTVETHWAAEIQRL